MTWTLILLFYNVAAPIQVERITASQACEAVIKRLSKVPAFRDGVCVPVKDKP